MKREIKLFLLIIFMCGCHDMQSYEEQLDAPTEPAQRQESYSVEADYQDALEQLEECESAQDNVKTDERVLLLMAELEREKAEKAAIQIELDEMTDLMLRTREDNINYNDAYTELANNYFGLLNGTATTPCIIYGFDALCVE